NRSLAHSREQQRRLNHEFTGTKCELNGGTLSSVRTNGKTGETHNIGIFHANKGSASADSQLRSITTRSGASPLTMEWYAELSKSDWKKPSRSSAGATPSNRLTKAQILLSLFRWPLGGAPPR